MKTALERKRAAAAKGRSAPRKPRPKVGAKQPIQPDVMYTYRQCAALFGIGRATLRRYEIDGMPTGGPVEKWVKGSDLMAAILRDGQRRAAK